MSIPLVQKAEKDDINTSIIAIKRQIERINSLLGLSNSEEIDTSVFATKDELQQAVTDLQPVDEVTADNMQSVTSNAVAARFSKSNYSSSEIDTGYKWIDGSTIYKRTFSYLSKELQYGESVELTNNCPIIPEKIRSVECFFKQAYISHTSAEIWFTKISGQDKCSINVNQTITSATYDVYITIYYVH